MDVKVKVIILRIIFVIIVSIVIFVPDVIILAQTSEHPACRGDP